MSQVYQIRHTQWYASWQQRHILPPSNTFRKTRHEEIQCLSDHQIPWRKTGYDENPAPLSGPLRSTHGKHDILSGDMCAAKMIHHESVGFNGRWSPSPYSRSDLTGKDLLAASLLRLNFQMHNFRWCASTNCVHQHHSSTCTLYLLLHALTGANTREIVSYFRYVSKSFAWVFKQVVLRA